MKTFKISFVLEGDFDDEKHAEKAVHELIDRAYPPEREFDGTTVQQLDVASNIEAREVKRL